MKSQDLIILLFIFFSFSVESQNLHTSKIIVDKTTKLPLENVNIFNVSDNSTTNAEGNFVFVSKKNEINFNLLGYNDFKTTFDKLKNKDTIFMDLKPIELEDVIVSDGESIIKKVHDSIGKNYVLTTYSENFFLRCLLKQNSEIVRLQDIYGKLSRNSVFKTDPNKKLEFAVEILNMRKTGIKEKQDIVYFKFPSLNEFLTLSSSILFNNTKYYDFTEIKSVDDNFRKINFVLKDKTQQQLNGYFLINREDYAIKEIVLDFYNDINSIPYQEIKGHKFRPTAYKITVNYIKNSKTNKYYLSNTRLEASTELLGDKKEASTIYDFTANLFIANSFTTEKVNSNFSIDKDIFKAKFPYSEDFWNNQNQLPLTADLKVFIKSVSDKKDKNKEYEVIGNF
ncbi:peptidase associated/transthyretin-like domain-containing protein [Flavobacterium gawalongense]|uniref:Carboxypeptidase-like regulatory domain-containing protein n=1 Tax=Flavobacterium gawalongense TaxID=2594432 RepID=A0A553BN68_9FLAO|nr:carboxypeptidase-like regulatory domain-containing protein [Flavobacterium gawalongense]TRX00156.1 carboxypeptidase-like regulatory domain-containing protein [Flavobacterium gawalongense]TRX04904.1 carboxypeptidase-like regulatory domain-containing protein [Flavobacterium gawalongense]TRX09682.1 carboxypeptidase-like regulatory domain-containing protein [Flavobacterium gawalongense]TRX10834.1 carboxypeptidase-like regulatory domain-containing protein [Flavobacterium gawalongense]TRX28087.1 